MRAESAGLSRDTGAVTDFTPLDDPVDDSPPTGIRAELSELDARLYAAVAGARTPTLDAFFRRLSRTADKSVLWLGVAGVMAVVGGRTGRRAAMNGVASIALASATANLVGKRVTNRQPP